MKDRVLSRLTYHWFALLILMVPVFFYHGRILFLGEILCGGDMISQFVPWREFALQEISQGRFPIWNPFVFCGTPFAANIQTSLFYPENFLHLLFSVERTFSLSLVFHQTMSLITMYFFLAYLWGSRAGAVIGALAYGWSGFFITHGSDGHLIHIRAYAWLPLAFYFQTRWRDGIRPRHIVLFAGSLAGMFYAGHTQIPLYVFYILLFRALGWGILDFCSKKKFNQWIRYPCWTLFGQGLSIGLAALVLVPLVELSRETSSRSGGARYEFATSDSMPPLHAITLFAPYFFGDPTNAIREAQFWETRTGYHEISGYVGILPLLLFLFAFLPSSENDPQKRFLYFESIFFALLAVGGILFALGNNAPFYSLLYYGLPGWNYFRVPGRLLFLFILGTSVLSARGFLLWQQLDFSAIQNRWPCKIGAVVSIGFLIVTSIVIFSQPAILNHLREWEIDRTLTEYGLWDAQRFAISQQLPEQLFQIRYEWILRSCLAACGWILGSWMVLFVMKRWNSSWTVYLPAGWLVIDLLLFSGHFTKTLPAMEWNKTYFPESELIEILKQNARGDRILCLDDAIGYPVIESHPELRPNRLMHYGIHTVRGYDPIILRSFTRYVNTLFHQDPDAPQGGLLFFPNLPSREDLDTMNVRLVLTSQSLPEPFRKIWRDENSKLTVYENPLRRSNPFWVENNDSSLLRILKSTPSAYQIEADLSTPNQLVFSQTFYQGWRIRDGNPNIQMLRYQDTFLSVTLPEGNQRLSLEMKPFSLWPLSSFGLGLLITGMSLLLCLFWVLQNEYLHIPGIAMNEQSPDVHPEVSQPK